MQSSFSPQQIHDNVSIYLNECEIIILKYENKNFSNSTHFYNQNILGKKIINYLVDNISPYKPKFIKIDTSNPIIPQISKKINNKKQFTVVLFCDTPLLQKETLHFCIEYAILKDLSFCKLPRGFIIKNIKINEITKDDEFIFDYKNDEFISIVNYSNLYEIERLIQQQIISKHIKNGVRFLNASSCLIEHDVVIEKGVVIYPNTSIYGNTFIKQSCIIKENSIIINSLVKENCKVLHSIISDCVISKNTTTKPFKEYRNIYVKE